MNSVLKMMKIRTARREGGGFVCQFDIQEIKILLEF